MNQLKSHGNCARMSIKMREIFEFIFAQIQTKRNKMKKRKTKNKYKQETKISNEIEFDHGLIIL